MSTKTWFLKRCRLFEQLTPEQCDRLERRGLLREFRRGELVYFPGQPGDSVLLLAKGRVKIKHLTPEGKEAILAFIDEGELFGELALVDDSPRDEYAEAVAASQVVAIPRKDLLWLVEQRPDVAMHITKLVGLRRRRIENRLRNLLFCSSRERVAAILLELLESHAHRDGDRLKIGLRLSHQELASLIGATRETVTVVLGNLQLERLIQVRRRRITVLDREGLVRVLNGPTASPRPAGQGSVAR
jgi:CRP-like cAMP-binding protein